ncbi:hypothetical protein [Paraglaciecola sp. MB-3u-78]|uniref:hypothetical protein n=1 Tax=Paraglaciecola sp. MB-3u-78 TaxID=2058332 RepID=UPI0012FE850A|nr:hypothetical protein [Paraglaciecola sp. MB-3u-78]
MSQTLKSSYSVLYGYQWLKDIKVESQLNHEPLLGKYLSEILDVSVDDLIQEAGKANLQRKPAPSATETVQTKINPHQTWANASKKHASDTTTKSATKSAKFSEISQSKADRQLHQVMLQQKAAKVTSLRDWMQKSAASEKVISPALVNKSPHKNQKKLRQVVKGKTSNSSKNLTALACNSSKWQQQINSNIQRIINQVLTNNVSLSSRQKQQLKQNVAIQNETNTLPLWQQKIATGNHKVQASLETLQYPLLKNEQLVKHSDKSNKTATAFVEQLAKSNRQRSARSQDNPAPQLKQTVKPALSLKTSDAKPTTLVRPEVEMAKPEFPPVSKMINQQLQVSGKRTALMRESQLLTQHEHDLDDEKLAEALKRIIDQQARRHGINV